MSETEFRLRSEEDASAAETGVELPSEDLSTTEDIPATETEFRLLTDDPPAAQAEPSAVVGPEKRTCPSCNQENEMAREFCWACHTMLGAQEAGNGAAPQPE